MQAESLKGLCHLDSDVSAKPHLSGGLEKWGRAQTSHISEEIL